MTGRVSPACLKTIDSFAYRNSSRSDENGIAIPYPPSMDFPMRRHDLRGLGYGTFPTGLAWLVAAAQLVAGLGFAQEVNKPLIQVFPQAETGLDVPSWVTRQGTDGVLYFGANSLLSFDGSRWRSSPINGAGAMRSLAFAPNGKLWAGATNELGWYDQNSDGSWSYRSLASKLPDLGASLGESWGVFHEKENAVFFTTDKIVRWNGTNFKTWPFPGAKYLSAMRVSGDIYVDHAPTGLYMLDAEGPRLLIPASVLRVTLVMWLDRIPGGLLLAMSHGLFTYIDGQIAPFAPEVSDYISRNRLTCVTRLPDGRVAFGTYRGGILLMNPDGTTSQIIAEKDGLPPDALSSLFVDRENGLWTTGVSSICRITLNSPSTLFSLPAELQRQPLNEIVRYQGKITVAGQNNISVMDPLTERFQSIDSTLMQIQDLLPQADGLLVAQAGGLRKISEGKIKVVTSNNQQVAAIAVPSSRWPSMVYTSEKKTVSLVDPEGKSRLIVTNTPSGVCSLAEDNQGRLWMGSGSHGLIVAKPNGTTPVEPELTGSAYGLPEGSEFVQVVGRKDGTILACYPNSTWLLNPESNRFVAVENCPPWKFRAASQIADDGTVWLLYPSTEHRAASVGRITIRGNHAVWEPHSVEGLWQIGDPFSILAENGANGETTLWIGGNNGFMRNIVAHGLSAPMPRPPILRALARSKDSDALQLIGKPLPYSTRDIVFDFAAPEFANRPALRLETMLVGVDQQWVPADASSRREFTALRDGRYEFRVRVVAETGKVSPPTVSHFEISPPWWRTGAALLGLVLALIPSAYGLYRWRLHRLRQRNAELEQKIIERTAQLEKASAAKTQFVANMSHDIRNPLNGIVGLALALEDSWLDAKQRELVTTLRECTVYLSTLVDDVLDFASIEAGKVELRPAPFAPVELLRSIVIMFRAEAISSGAVLQVEADPQLPRNYVGDAGRIQQILVNFASNAMKYAGGPIKLSVTIPADAPEEIEFSVTDEGPGISEDNQQLLFVKFSRLTEAQSKEITGTGLGLAACRILAGLMSGSVGVQSSPGHGARFYLRLPLDIFPMPAVDSPTTPAVLPVMKDYRVLLVEDTNYNAMAAAAVLGKFGLACERASTGAEAITLFTGRHFNLVLLDRNLPDMDGTEVARRLRALEANGPRAIILAVTAYCTLEDRASCLSAGMDAFVGKPLTPQKLRRVLAAAGRRNLAAASIHVSPDAPSAGVDVSLLEYISDGTNHGLNRQIELFLNNLTDAEKQLQQAARTGDFKELADAAHSVLSHARLVGSTSLSNAAAGLQNAALAQSRDAFSPLLQRVCREIESLKAVVRRHPGAERPA